MIYLCENKDCQRKMESAEVAMTIEQPMFALPEKMERRKFAFCSRGCFVEFCHGLVYRGSPMAIDSMGNKQWTSIPSSIEYPLAPWK